MAVGQTTTTTLLPIKGVRIGVANAGIRQTERPDIALFELAPSATVSAVFTKNRFCASPVKVAKQHLSEGTPSYLLINSGNANAGVGPEGDKDALQCCQAVADHQKVTAQQVLPFSTGVIGERLPLEKLLSTIPEAISNLSEEHWQQAARAIMTTDTREKAVSKVIMMEGEKITITGISKGSGMIEPNMATMLAYIATDMPIAEPVLNTIIKEATNQSFNCISVDGDTSTNDAVVLVATGCAKVSELKSKEDSRYEVLYAAIEEVFKTLAEAIVRDGEGATKLIHVSVKQAATIDDARSVAYTIARSPLVKTAMFASDPNWGRILAAIGRAPIESLNVDAINIYLDDVCIVCSGVRDQHYTEARGQQVMQRDEITLKVELAAGGACAHVITCDLSYDYVKINAEYRT